MTRKLSTLAATAMVAAAMAVGGLAAPAAAAPAKRYDVRDFFRNPERSRFTLSPDGKMLAFLAPYEGRRNLFVQPVDGSAPPHAITRETARDLRGFFWKGSDRILFAKDFGGDENFHVVAAPINGKADGSDVRDLTPYEGVRASIVDDLKDDPQHVLIQHNKRDRKVFDVYRVDVNTGAETLIAQNPGNIDGWLTDHHGRLRAAVATDGVNSSLLYRDDESQPFRTLLTTDFRESVSPQFFTFDDKKLYVVSNRGRDKAAAFIFDPATAKEESLVFESKDVDVEGLSYSRKRKVLVSAGYVTAKPEIHWFDPVFKAAYDDVVKQLPGYEIDLQGATDDESRVIVAAYNDRTQGARYVYDLASKKLTKLGEITPWLAEADMAPMKPITYTSRDGLTINGYLTLPVGVEPKNLPVVVNPHGGPWARDVWGYNPEVQFLANRGYAVLQMNFRGSTGYGRKFWEASFKQWGGSMQNDVTDGVQWLVKQGIADPKRIAIYGGSYGGYATLAGITFTPDLYAAAVDYVGVANLFTFMNTIPPYWEQWRKQMYEMVGDPEKDKDLMRARSPVFHVDQIKTPLFVAQGARDPRVNKAESDQIVEALKKRGVEVEYMVKDNEGHGFHNEENRFAFYGAMETFLAKHLKQ